VSGVRFASRATVGSGQPHRRPAAMQPACWHGSRVGAMGPWAKASPRSGLLSTVATLAGADEPTATLERHAL